MVWKPFCPPNEVKGYQCSSFSKQLAVSSAFPAEAREPCINLREQAPQTNTLY
jgi:hypothetical protein